MNQHETKELRAALNTYDNVGDMIKHIYTTYDCHQKINLIYKTVIINGLVSAAGMLDLKKYS